jgi:hypothetical protein
VGFGAMSMGNRGGVYKEIFFINLRFFLPFFKINIIKICIKMEVIFHMPCPLQSS